MKEADKAISIYVRKRTHEEYGQCPLCLKAPIQCCFHFIRRKRKILRWDERNLIGTCHGDNYKEYRNPDPSRAWFIRKFGVDQYLKLVDESGSNFEPTEEYLIGIIKRYNGKVPKV